MLTCDVCGNPYQHGQHRYEGHKLELYGGIFACDTCWKANHDGWSPQREEVLLGILDHRNLPAPERNSKGLLPRD